MRPCRKRRRQGKVREQKPSQFVLDIQEELLERSLAASRRKRPRDTDAQLDLFSDPVRGR